ncbi:hypothetical protein INT43_002765 [Umbelopsis isabellina]|uniref:Uncharacterized protein n=1 Tax=Mortierella isabellina TaxID=91625 RepID=A0A8H7Q572_MORIS|nr:hypothetical protein INT43_002765 [Umbelopsis isabellina]
MPSKQVQFSSDTHIITTHSNEEYDRTAIQVEKMSYMDMYELLIFKSQMQQAVNSQRSDETNSVTSSLANDLQTSSTVAVELCT